MVITFSGTQSWIFAVRLFIYHIISEQYQVVDSQICNMKILDPFWPAQWYLNKSSNNYDMNVLPAWRSCINGTGVTVGVVDMGIQNHFDLNVNRSLNFGSVGRGTVASLKHGTRAAGIIGAMKNRFETVGIAFGSELADLKIASSAVFNTFNTAALTFRKDIIDIYSCSFANFHTGTKTYPLLRDQEDAFRLGTSLGRGGLGSLYVFATGNSGGEESDILRDSCAYDRLVSNKYVIAVAGIQHDLQKLPNGEACSAMMVAAFTSAPGTGSFKLTTTDIGNSYTQNFNQNSAAAPMVSGAVALALSANSYLTYRDIMHLIVETSSYDLNDSKYRSYFFRNAANHFVSSYFGFGLLNIGKLVEKSKTWKNIPPRIDCTNIVTFDIGMRNHNNYFAVPFDKCRASYVEHVEVLLKVNNLHAGQIKWDLISPYGTKSTVLPGRGLDSTTNMDLTVLTVQMWGENSIGYWKLEPSPVFGKRLENGTIDSIAITIHGFDCTYDSRCLSPAQQEKGRWSVWSHWSQWSASCGSGTRTRYRECIGHSVSRFCVGKSSQKITSTLPVCPSNTNGDNNCPSSSSLTSRCVEQCSSDTECREQGKCCFNGCGHTCERTDIYCKGSVAGLNYRGTVNTTESGLKCQAWSQNAPHSHRYTVQLADQHNYCRNPDKSAKPWCYTTDPHIRYQFCNIPVCDIDCKRSEAGLNYRGTVNITESGLKCQAWSQNAPHSHRYTVQLADQHNYCRNPDKSAKPWCYTTDPNIRYQFCNIPVCGKQPAKCRTPTGLPFGYMRPCFRDQDCFGIQKCCYNGRGKSCSVPDY
ncbi:endoprotease bli-like isoform X1 [Mytilus galloprovincialis]|uniref:endoprotease bli-like isoform X1 n=1 Tax=Mytilus galloprovincialis TaxID=29158 RepID=UPI003F7B4F64